MELHNTRIGLDISSQRGFRAAPWLPGYVASLDDYTFHELVRRDPGVKFAENQIRRPPRQGINDTIVYDDSLSETISKRSQWFKRVYPNSSWNLRL